MHGKRTMMIKKFNLTEDHCRNCKSFDLDIRVYRDYYHFILLPIIPTGDKNAKIYCNRCGEGLRIEAIRKRYEKAAKTPLYLYTGLIFFMLIICAGILGDLYDQSRHK
jgi:hypothetical protein